MRLIPFALALLVAACTSAPEPRIQLAPVAPATVAADTVVRSIELREISLPYYAEGEEIGVASADGTVLLRNDVLWADLPPRALTLRLAQTLAARLPETAVAAEPWPLLSRADLRIEIQVSRALGQVGGDYALEGQYFIVAGNLGEFERAQSFALLERVDGGGLNALALAQSEAFDRLADLIVTDVADVEPRDIGRR